MGWCSPARTDLNHFSNNLKLAWNVAYLTCANRSCVISVFLLPVLETFYYLLLSSPCFGTPGRLCFLTVTFPWHVFVYLYCRFFSGGFTARPPPVVYSTDHSKVVVPVLVLLFVALWFILRGDLFYVLPCVILFLCFSVI